MSYLVQIPRRSGWFRKASSHLDIVNGNDTVDQRALRRVGLRGFQPGTTAALLTLWQLNRRSLTFFDVGANGGLYAWLCKAMHGRSTVYAFEPQPEVADALMAVCEANGLDVTCVRVAVSDKAGSAKLFLSAKSDASNSLTEGFREARGEIEVETITLDGFVQQQSLRPTVIKVDVEQHERQVLAGARNTLETLRPDLVVEILPGSRKVSDSILSELEDLGYEGVKIKPTLLNSDQEDPQLRDWVFSHRGLPADFDKHFDRWCRAVSECEPGHLTNSEGDQGDQSPRTAQLK